MEVANEAEEMAEEMAEVANEAEEMAEEMAEVVNEAEEMAEEMAEVATTRARANRHRGGGHLRPSFR